jgi:hypothetical protein
MDGLVFATAMISIGHVGQCEKQRSHWGLFLTKERAAPKAVSQQQAYLNRHGEGIAF